MPEDPVLKVMTFNICSCNTMDHGFDPAAAANAIKNVSPDVCGVQEIRKVLAPNPADCPAILGKTTGMKAEFGFALSRNEPEDAFEYGIAALSRLPSELAEIIPLPHSDNEPRVAVVLKVKKDDRTFYFITTHFSYEDGFHEERCAQMKAILDTVKAKGYTPAVLTGDLNAFPEDPCIAMLEKEWQIANPGMLTFSTAKPSVQIDYVAYYPTTAFSVKSTQLIRDRITSDHFPIVADLYFRPEK